MKSKARGLLQGKTGAFAFSQPSQAQNQASSNLYSFEETISPVKDEIDQFLADKNLSLSMLDNHKAMRAVFVKSNTAIPSSAPVERLSSQAALVLTAKRNRLSDKLFEELLLLKIHKKL